MTKFVLVFSLLIFTGNLFAQPGDKSKRPSPPDSVSHSLPSGAVITINYSKPSVKGRKIGVDLEPLPGKVWRTGANEATVFETSKNIKIEGQSLPAGKYGLFTLVDENGGWTIIFNKKWNQWGAYKYDAKEDVLRVALTPEKVDDFTEIFTILIYGDNDTKAVLLWGDARVAFHITEQTISSFPSNESQNIISRKGNRQISCF